MTVPELKVTAYRTTKTLETQGENNKIQFQHLSTSSPQKIHGAWTKKTAVSPRKIQFRRLGRGGSAAHGPGRWPESHLPGQGSRNEAHGTSHQTALYGMNMKIVTNIEDDSDTCDLFIWITGHWQFANWKITMFHRDLSSINRQVSIIFHSWSFLGGWGSCVKVIRHNNFFFVGSHGRWFSGIILPGASPLPVVNWAELQPLASSSCPVVIRHGNRQSAIDSEKIQLAMIYWIYEFPVEHRSFPWFSNARFAYHQGKSQWCTGIPALCGAHGSLGAKGCEDRWMIRF